MQWKPKQVILRVYFMYTVNEMRLGELVKTVLHSEHPNYLLQTFFFYRHLLINNVFSIFFSVLFVLNITIALLNY